MLQTLASCREGIDAKKTSYLVQIVPVTKVAIAGVAVVVVLLLVVVQVSLLREDVGTIVALMLVAIVRDRVGPMIQSIHVLLDATSRTAVSVASVTFIQRLAVPSCIEMLLT